MYELPFGESKWYGGWQFSGIGYWRTGYPSPRGRRRAILSTTPGGTGQRPNVVGNWELDNPTVDKWFEPTAFQPPADTTGTYGDAGRNIMRGPEQFNIDMSLIKYTRFGRFNLELRCEAFNLLNHAQFQKPQPHDRQRGRGARSPRCCRTRRARSAARRSATSSSRRS